MCVCVHVHVLLFVRAGLCVGGCVCERERERVGGVMYTALPSALDTPTHVASLELSKDMLVDASLFVLECVCRCVCVVFTLYPPHLST